MIYGFDVESSSQEIQQIPDDDPTATYRGYRRQVLYCLFRLFDDTLPSDSILQPEGQEDLAIRNSHGDLIEVIQVKDYTKNLTISDFKLVFFQRISKYCIPSSIVKVTIAHFGELGPELSTALDNDQSVPKRTTRTLKDKGLKDTEIKNILTHLTAVKVEETTLHEFILEKLKGIVTSGNPQQAFENLMWWLMNASENQLRLNRRDVVGKINQIGEFLSQRLAHEQEWNTSIVPILMEQGNCSEQQKREFYRGGRVQPIHIANNLDIPRSSLLKHIHQQFLSNDVVIIRAASGQGKTTLAYRYISDYCPNDFRFEVLRPTDIQHARSMALAISGHAEAIDVPTLLYLDVRPGDKTWVEFVREITFLPNLNVLITIREEDWFKSQVSVGDFTFSEVSLNFDEMTGESLFLELSANTNATKYLNFEDAWTQLGERKTLFEFVFFITQEQQLANKIKEQVASLQDDVRLGKLHPNELKLLRLVAVASTYETRLQLKGLIKHCEISEPQRTLQQFSDEFLVRTSDDGHFIEGFHAIRSEIMCSQLLDDVLEPWQNFAQEIIPLLDESDLELFLLCSFSRQPEFVNDIVSAVSAFTPNTWIGVRGVCIALQWFGLNNYIDRNLQIIRDARVLVGSGWWIMLDWDVAKVNGNKGFGVFSNLVSTLPNSKLAAEASEKLIDLQTDKANVFSDFEVWIRRLAKLPSTPNSSTDLLALTETMLWVGHLRIDTPQVEWVSEHLLDKALNDLPIYLFAEFAIATRIISDHLYIDWYQKNEGKLKTKIQKECGIVSIAESDDCLIGHYLIGLDRKISQLRSGQETRIKDNNINSLSVERVEVLHRCIPGYERYGAKGYGHLVSLFNLHYDESEKRMPVENIILPWLPNFNALARGAVERRFRPETWDVYFNSINQMREGVLDGLRQLDHAVRLAKIRSKKVFKNIDQWNQRKSSTTNEFILPLVAVDEWGYISESRAEDGSDVLSLRFAALSQIEPYTKFITKYRHSIGNFMRQSQDAIVLLFGLRVATSELERKICLEKAEELGIQDNCIALSVMNSIDALKTLGQLHQQEVDLQDKIHHSISTRSSQEQEYDQLHRIVYQWCKFTYPEQFPEQTQGRSKKKLNKFPAKESLRSCLSPTLNRIKHSLLALKKQGVRAGIISETIKWNQERALWVSFDVDSAIDLFLAIEPIWNALTEALQPDNDKKARQGAMRYYWERIVLVPLVRGKSLERHVYANMQIRTAHLCDNPHEQSWRFIPEIVPEALWEKLFIPIWESSREWTIFQDFADAYGNLYQYIEHLADVMRIESLEANPDGEAIARSHIELQQKLVEPHLQEVFDAVSGIANNISGLSDEAYCSRPNIEECLELVHELHEIVVPPTQETEGTYTLSSKEIGIWLDQLETGLTTLGCARYLWITDLLEKEVIN